MWSSESFGCNSEDAEGKVMQQRSLTVEYDVGSSDQKILLGMCKESSS